MDDDRRVAWMRETLQHKLVCRGYDNLSLVACGNIRVFARQLSDGNDINVHFNARFFNAGWAVKHYTTDLGTVMSRLVEIIALCQRVTVAKILG